MKAGLFGYPLGHSMSKILHQIISKTVNFEYLYDILPKEPNEFVAFAKDCISSNEYIGFNITVPYKNEILKLDVKKTDTVLKSGCANTLLLKEGEILAYNTDIYGIIKLLEKLNRNIKNDYVLILGAGGAAKGLICALKELGVAKIDVFNRTYERARALSDETVNAVLNTSEHAPEYDLIINATSVGMYPHSENTPIENLEQFTNLKDVVDLIYNPMETILLKQAKKSGINALNGAAMLVYQGIFAFEIWTGIHVSDDDARHIEEEFCKQLWK